MDDSTCFAGVLEGAVTDYQVSDDTLVIWSVIRGMMHEILHSSESTKYVVMILACMMDARVIYDLDAKFDTVF